MSMTIHSELDQLASQAIRCLHQGRDARDLGDDDTATDCFVDAASLVEEAGELAGRNGLDMPGVLDMERGLVDLFQSVAAEAYERRDSIRAH